MYSWFITAFWLVARVAGGPLPFANQVPAWEGRASIDSPIRDPCQAFTLALVLAEESRRVQRRAEPGRAPPMRRSRVGDSAHLISPGGMARRQRFSVRGISR